MAEPPTIETERLLLRQWRAADKEPFAALNADPDVMEHFPALITPAESDRFVDRMASVLAEKGRGLWAAEEKQTHTFIGFIGLNLTRFDTLFSPRIEVGWRLARRSWGHGYATEGATAAITYGFAHVELPGDEIISFTTEGNVRSRRVMEKLGLTHDPTRDFDHPELPAWPDRRHVLYAIGRAEWHRAARGGGRRDR